MGGCFLQLVEMLTNSHQYIVSAFLWEVIKTLELQIKAKVFQCDPQSTVHTCPNEADKWTDTFQSWNKLVTACFNINRCLILKQTVKGKSKIINFRWKSLVCLQFTLLEFAITRKRKHCAASRGTDGQHWWTYNKRSSGARLKGAQVPADTETSSQDSSRSKTSTVLPTWLYFQLSLRGEVQKQHNDEN